MAGLVGKGLASQAWGRCVPCDSFFTAICYRAAGGETGANGAAAVGGAERGVAGESVG